MNHHFVIIASYCNAAVELYYIFFATGA